MHRAHGVEQLAAVVDALLEQVCPAGRPALQQFEDVRGLGVLAEDDDADLRMCLAEPRGDADTLVFAGRRHADVGHHDVRTLVFNRRDQSRALAHGGNRLDVGCV